MHSYPLGIFNESVEESEEGFNRGFIFYDEFEVFNDRKISFKKTLPDKHMSHGGMIKINRQEYNKLLGL